MKNLSLALILMTLGFNTSAFAGACDVTVPVYAREDLLAVLGQHHYTPVYEPAPFKLELKDLSRGPITHRAKFRISLRVMNPAPKKVADITESTLTFRQNLGGLTYRWFRMGVKHNKARALQKAIADFDQELNGHDCTL